MTDKLPSEKEILTAANQLLDQYHGAVDDAKAHATQKADEFKAMDNIDGHLVWLKILKAVIELTDMEHDGETVH